MRCAAVAIFACIIGASVEASEVHELNGYTSRFFPLQRLELNSLAGPANDVLVVPGGWVSGRTENGSSWVGPVDERYVVQIAATESDLEGAGAAQRRDLLDALHQRYSRDVVVRHEGDSTFFEATSEMAGVPGPARVRSLIRIWPQGGQINMLQFHVIVGTRDWGTPEAEDLIQLFRAQLARAKTARPGEAEQGRSPRSDQSAAQGEGMPRFVSMAELVRKLGPLKTVSLDGYRFRVPGAWDTGRDDGGAAWAASPNRDYALERRVRVLPAGPDWRATVKRRGAEILHDLTGTDIAGELAGGSLERMFALQIPSERSDHAGFKVWHWPQLLHIDGVIVEAWLSLHVRQNLWHAPETEDLEQLFGQQFTDQPPGDPRLLGSQATGFGLDRLRAMRAFGFVDLNVPARWYDEFDEDQDLWVAGEDEPDTGTFWISYDLYGGDLDDIAADALAQQFSAAGAVPRPTAHLGRKLFHETHSAREKGELLHFNRWILVERRGAEMILLQFTLVIGRDQEAHPEFVNLVRTMEREVAGVTIGEFPQGRN